MKPISTTKAAIFVLLLALATCPLTLRAQVSPGAGNNGAPSTPPSGNYPGTGSSPQPGVPPPPLAPSGPTPGSGNGGATNTPPSGVTPGSGTSPNPMH